MVSITQETEMKATAATRKTIDLRVFQMVRCLKKLVESLEIADSNVVYIWKSRGGGEAR